MTLPPADAPVPATSAAPASASAVLPGRCDVLVVGAGPAGSACATVLAQAGIDVLLIDQHDFPREKICGDGLIADAHAALQRLGAYDAVMAQAWPVRQVRCVAPSGKQVDVDGHLAVLPRKVLDHLLLEHARAAGAQVHTPVRFEAPIEQAGRTVGARLQVAGATQEVQARWVVMATGAAMPAMVAAGLCERRTPSGIALRGYVRNPGLAGRHTTMDVVWHRALRPGYGWVFPAGPALWNIGVGAFFRTDRHGRGRAADANLREMFQAFTEVYAPARALMDGGTLEGDLKGAPLRCTLQGASTGRPGLLATGEAIGSTYDFTGEGIGKAMETGILAADTLLLGLRAPVDGPDDARLVADYRQRIDALRPKFSLYEKANRVNRHPWLADLVIGRAQHSARLRQRMSGVLNETSNPGHLLTARGLWKLFTD
jgi:geranylgeranyl reductase family protein